MKAAISQDVEMVDAQALERELEVVRIAAAGSLEGVFGPHSVTWRVDREAAIFLGAGRALLLQLAHPWVAAAIGQHSDAFADPVGRFHRTFRVVLTMVFGRIEQSLGAARALHRRHAAISGMMLETAGPFPAGSCYCANSVPALRWVHATLTETALMVYRLVLPGLTPHERERYYAESRIFAGLLGIPQTNLPESWSGFSAYTEAMVQSEILTLTDSARAMAHRLLAGTDTWLPIPAAYRALTAELLPPRLRRAFALDHGRSERRAAGDLLRWAQRLYPSLPGRLRYVGPYQEARQRLAGRAQPDLGTWLSNRFWIGRGDMPWA
jgi:uncharacterized protein (DUF2236 family)